jgi:hypothetical protein
MIPRGPRKEIRAHAEVKANEIEAPPQTETDAQAEAEGAGRALMHGRAPRQKGDRTERAIVRLLQDKGLAAERVPLSGSAGGRYSGDLTVPVLGRDLKCEVKCRGNGFRRLYDWLNGADVLIVRADRREPLVVLPMRLAAEIAARAEGRKACEGRLPFVAHPPIGDA